MLPSHNHFSIHDLTATIFKASSLIAGVYKGKKRDERNHKEGIKTGRNKRQAEREGHGGRGKEGVREVIKREKKNDLKNRQ